jgi:CelD/BcsL family acetyltransferase involved in cellulose biosynthesis
VGLMCKILSIKDAIETGRKKYDFLKGAETYKYRLGGIEVPLSYCKINL